MKSLNKYLFSTLIIFISLFLTVSCQRIKMEDLKFRIAIPAEGNSWIDYDSSSYKDLIGEGGIKNWSNENLKIKTWFKTEQAGKIDIGLISRSVSGNSSIKVICGTKSETIMLKNTAWDTIPIGTFTLENSGYQCVEIQGIYKSGEFFPEIESFLIGGEASDGNVYFVGDDFYWGRRGPSVHLNFQIPEEAGEVEYFYNEITVPENNDVLGSYFMADGFGQGYFGIQVNSPDERRILFSVWSPYKTDNPQDIPEDQKIKLLKKGEEVYTGEFGNEGSGGQSYFRFMWKAGTTYKFLLHGKPTGKGETDFTAWFFAPELGNWKLIASWRRPKTNTYLTHLYSFLENFYTETGNITRKGLFSNQWIYTSKKQWMEITKIKFTADATARKQSRMDYAGGTDGNSFFLQNCGFFNETTSLDSYFNRPETGHAPNINFDKLP